MNAFSARREKILQQIGNDGLAILFAAPEQRRSNDTEFSFRQDSYFHYLSGFPESEAAIILDGATGMSILFCRDKDPLMEAWNGFRYGASLACEKFMFNAAYSINEWQEHLRKLLVNKRYFYALWGLYPNYDKQLLLLWHEVQQQAGHRMSSSETYAPDHLIDLSTLLNPMRLIKDEYEIDLLKKAGEISALAHIRAMQKTRAGLSELQIEAELLHEFMRHHARFPAYNSIVASGKNACCLHYTENKDVLRDGDLLLIDAGAEYQFYAGDITRTFPINGKFSSPQKDLYEVVLSANEAAIAAIKPGVKWIDVHYLSLKILVQGLIDHHILQGSIDENIESAAYKRFYMHGLGHWVGLDVHDVGGRWHQGESISLQAGMYTTIEPGLYINAADDVPEAFHNLGIRIEDNILVTESGHLNYTAAAPKSVKEIEDIMQY